MEAASAVATKRSPQHFALRGSPSVAGGRPGGSECNNQQRCGSVASPSRRSRGVQRGPPVEERDGRGRRLPADLRGTAGLSPPRGDAAEDASQIVLPEAGSERDQLSELLADPALLGPVGVLGATIGLPRPEDGPDGGNTESEEEDGGGGAPPVDFIIKASSATAQPQFPQVPAGEVLADSAAPPLPAEEVEDRGPIDWDLVQVEPHAAESREENLELTLRAILGHIAGDDGNSVADDDNEDEGSVVAEAFLNEPSSAAPATENAGAETSPEPLDRVDPDPELGSPGAPPSDGPLRRMDEILQQAELISESFTEADGEEEAAALLGEAEALEREGGELLRRAEAAAGLLEEPELAEAAEEAGAAAELDDEKQLENDLAEAEGSKLIEDELRLSSTDEETESERGNLARQPDERLPHGPQDTPVHRPGPVFDL